MEDGAVLLAEGQATLDNLPSGRYDPPPTEMYAPPTEVYTNPPPTGNVGGPTGSIYDTPPASGSGYAPGGWSGPASGSSPYTPPNYAPPPVPYTPPPLPSTLGASPNKEQGLAVASVICGALSLVCFGPLTGIVAIVLGFMARSKAQAEPERYGGEGLALAGMILGGLGSVVFILSFFMGVFSSIVNR
jgi:hypothetical protein